MTIPLASILVAYGLIWPPKLLSSWEQSKLEGGYDNKDPRVQRQKLSERGRRAQAAHENSMETFAPFAAAVLVAHLANADATLSSAAAITFCVARALYPWPYVSGMDLVRSGI